MFEGFGKIGYKGRPVSRSGRKINPGDQYMIDHYSFHYADQSKGVSGKGYVEHGHTLSIIPYKSKINVPMIKLLEKQLKIRDEILKNPIYWLDKENNLLCDIGGSHNNSEQAKSNYVNGKLSEIKRCAFFLGTLNSRGIFTDSWEISDIIPNHSSVLEFPYYHDISQTKLSTLPHADEILRIGRPKVINEWIQQDTKLNMGSIDINKRDSIVFKTIEDILFMNIRFSDLTSADSFSTYTISKKKEPPRIIISEESNYFLQKGTVPVSQFRKPLLEKMKEFNNLEYKKGWF